jgi:hypothetical protein
MSLLRKVTAPILPGRYRKARLESHLVIDVENDSLRGMAMALALVWLGGLPEGTRVAGHSFG